ncbi:lipase chaperone [Telluria mixta]|uniref:Lipase helper protein n=1 Tax=Telluria mixta TaxID=34071 RepID=A0ABT2BXR8_9BURK|nr:lipase secretion chaperone [Telluria mixta]MCS0629934.1 lipase chaperone [Telluria mixta]WEM96513.1 lipase secretion chaperone [Telluria mixta]
MNRNPTIVFALGAAGTLWLAVVAGRPAPAVQTVHVARAAKPFAPSLQGTRPDGAVRVAPDDSVVADAQLIELFDYYLSTVGEKSPAAVRTEIERELDRTLRPAAAAAAKRVLTRYIAYRQALAGLQTDRRLTGPDAAALKRRLNALRGLRAQYFSQREIAAIFGREDAANAEALARMEIRDDRTLSAQQKQTRLAALDAGLPADVRAARETPLKIVRVQEEAERLRAGGANEEDVFRLRADAFGADAAQRLADVDSEEAAWKRRIEAYLVERRGLRDEAEIAALRNRMFSEDEQRRLAAYEGGPLP